MKNVSRKPERRCLVCPGLSVRARLAMMVRRMVRRGARRKRPDAVASQTVVTMSVTREVASPLLTLISTWATGLLEMSDLGEMMASSVKETW